MNIDTASDDYFPPEGRTGNAPEVGQGPGVPFATEGAPIGIAGGP
jgi:hypothetical protein